PPIPVRPMCSYTANAARPCRSPARRATARPVLRGTGINASALYPLAPIVGNIWKRPAPVNNTNNRGGGLEAMTIEGGGLTTDENGNGVPAVAVYGGQAQRFSDLYIRDAIGAGNSVFRCGQNDLFPTGNLDLNSPY